MSFYICSPMPDDVLTPSCPLVPITPADSRELIAIALGLTMGAVRKANIAREANSAVADRLLAYFEQSGIVLMRPPPARPHSNNPRAGQPDALADD